MKKNYTLVIFSKVKFILVLHCINYMHFHDIKNLLCRLLLCFVKYIKKNENQKNI